MATFEKWAKVFKSRHQYLDSVPVQFGNAKDAAIQWDGTNLTLKPVTDDTGAFVIGDGTTDMDVKVFMNTTAKYVLFDQSGSLVTLVGTAMTLGADTAGTDLKLFGATTGNYLLWDASEDDLLLVGTSTQLAVAGTTTSTNSTSGSLRTAGGLGVAGTANIGSTLGVVGVLTVSNATEATSVTAAALVVTGGIANSADCYFGDDIFLTSGAVLNFNAGDVTITHSADTLTIAGATSLDLAADTIYIGSTGEGKIVSADADTTIYGGNTSADQLRLRGNSADAGPILYVVGNSRVYIAGQFQVSERVYINSSMDLQQGQYLYFGGDASTEYIRSNTAQELQLGANSVVRIAAPYLTMLTANKLAFRDAELFINSPADGRLGISSDGTGVTAISIDATGGQIQINTTAINIPLACYLDMSAAATGSYGLKLGVAADGFSIYTVNGDIMVFDTRVGGAVQFPTNVNMSGLPVADPHVVGCLWNNSTVVTVSAG